MKLLQILSRSYQKHIFFYVNVDLKNVTFDLLSKISVMTDRAAAIKCFDRIFADFIKTELGRDVDVHFYIVMCISFLVRAVHVRRLFLRLRKNCSVRDSGSLGEIRMQNLMASMRCQKVIRTACDILGPRGDQICVQRKTFCTNFMIPC